VLANQSELNSDLESRARRVHFGPLPEKHFAPITSLKLQRRNKKSKKRRTSSSSSSSSGSSKLFYTYASSLLEAITNDDPKF
jgi:hypothetical protein